MFSKLEKALGFQVKEAFYAFGFIFTDENVAKFKLQLEEKHLIEMRNELTFDVNEDNIEVFLLQTKKMKSLQFY